jgi:L-fucose mutarotase
MLKHIPALLTPDALHALASMGHGDTLAVVDAHFPAARIAGRAGAPGAPGRRRHAPAVLRAVLALVPLDEAAPEAAWTMQVIGQPDAVPPAVAAIRATLAEAGERAPATVERHAFYEAAARAFAVFICGQTRACGIVLPAKGVLR